MPGKEFWENLGQWNGQQLAVAGFIVVVIATFAFLLKFTAPGVIRFEARRMDRHDALLILQDQVKVLAEQVAKLQRHVEELERRDRHHVQLDAARVGREHLLMRECNERRELMRRTVDRWDVSGEAVPADIRREVEALQDAQAVASAIPLPEQGGTQRLT